MLRTCTGVPLWAPLASETFPERRGAPTEGRPYTLNAHRVASITMLVSDFDYDLPEHLIAQEPPAERDHSRLLIVDRANGGLVDSIFTELPDHLRAGDLLVLNNTRVFPARLK